MRLFTFFALSLLLSGLTAQTPVLLADINPGEENSSPTRFFPYGDRALFRADNDTIGVELYITDGTPEGTLLLANINADNGFRGGNSNPDQFIEYDGRVFFRAQTPENGSELWVTDGTPEGTMLFFEFQAGDANGNPFDPIIFDGMLYFTATDGNDNNGSELWRTDGTPEGTELVADINPNGSSNPSFKTVFKDRLFFSANDGTSGIEVWSTDGTAEGTMLLKDIRTEGNGNAQPGAYFAVGDSLYFRANDGVFGRELYLTDGTADGTRLLVDLQPGDGSSSPDDFFQVGETVFFIANNGTTGSNLYRIDTLGQIRSVGNLNVDVSGESDAREITEIIPNEAYLFVADTSDADDGAAFFLATAGGIDGFELSELDLTEPGDTFADPEDLVFTGSHVYFTYESGATGRELGRISLVEDMDDGGTITALPEIVAGPEGSSIDELTLLGNRIIFEAATPATGREPYALDALTAYVTLTAADGTPVESGDTLRFEPTALGFFDTLRIRFQNTGTSFSEIIGDDGELSDPFEVAFAGGADSGLLPPLPGEAFVVLSFMPEELGTTTDRLSVSFLTAAGPSTVFFFLSGTAVASELDVADATGSLANESELVFDDVEAGTDSTILLTLSSVGEGDLLINSIRLSQGSVFTVTRTDGTPVNGTDTLSGAETVELAITFSPTEADLTSTDVLVINGNAGRFAINLTGNSIVNSITDRGLPARALYPNPTTGTVRLELTEALPTGGDWRLIDPAGRLLRDGNWPAGQRAHTLDLSGLPTGVYQLMLTDGSRSLTARVAKQ